MPMRPARASLLLELQNPNPKLDAQEPHQSANQASTGNELMRLLRRVEPAPIHRQREQRSAFESRGTLQQALTHMPPIPTRAISTDAAFAPLWLEDDPCLWFCPFISRRVK